MSVPSEGNTPYGPGWSHLGTLLTIPEVAAILNVSVPRVYELIRLRLLPAVHLGRQVRVKTGRPGGMVSPRRPTAADRSRLIRPPPQNASRIIQAIALICVGKSKEARKGYVLVSDLHRPGPRDRQAKVADTNGPWH